LDDDERSRVQFAKCFCERFIDHTWISDHNYGEFEWACVKRHVDLLRPNYVVVGRLHAANEFEHRRVYLHANGIGVTYCNCEFLWRRFLKDSHVHGDITQSQSFTDIPFWWYSWYRLFGNDHR
jgi:hypothetical protein